MRPIYKIAQDISANWENVNYAALPYLQAMHGLNSISDKYGFDNAKTIVLYFLSNAKAWRGEKAKAIKIELKGLL